jgi:resuscitation-promoting factor RpfA
VNVAAKPAPAQPAQAAKTGGLAHDTAIELGGGALALLALGGAAFAIARRRRNADEDEYYADEATGDHFEPVAEPEPIPAEQPVAEAEPARHEPEVMAAAAPAGASAFAWGNGAPAEQASDDDGSDRRPGETWVERAYRGPSPANPSVSLRARLRRAAFFDKREREVAAGTAEPVDADEGLPEAMIEEQEDALA